MLAPDKIPPFDAKAFLSGLQAGKTTLTFRANDEIYAQGSPSDSVYFLTKGRVKLTLGSANGKEAILAIIGANNFFGDGCLASLEQRLITATAVDDVTVIRLEADAMKRALRDEPIFSEFFIAFLVNRKISTQMDLVAQLINSSEKRLARLLLQLTEASAQEDLENAAIKISQDTLADMVGTTRSRVSFFMNKFRRLGFIEYKSGLRVRRSLLSKVLNERS
jgi:CRP-like cAMP-binding protein